MHLKSGKRIGGRICVWVIYESEAWAVRREQKDVFKELNRNMERCRQAQFLFCVYATFLCLWKGYDVYEQVMDVVWCEKHTAPLLFLELTTSAPHLSVMQNKMFTKSTAVYVTCVDVLERKLSFMGIWDDIKIRQYLILHSSCWP